MYLYLGRRRLSLFALNVAKVVSAKNARSHIIVSRQNDMYPAFAELTTSHVAVDAFSSKADHFARAWGVIALRRQIQSVLQRFRPRVIIDLMPFAGSHVFAATIKSEGGSYVPVIHDALVHPNGMKRRGIGHDLPPILRQADAVVTLSGAVSRCLEATDMVAEGRLYRLFYPDLACGCENTLPSSQATGALRLLCLGRLLPDSLPLFLDMIEALRRRGVAVDCGVVGEGNLETHGRRLAILKAEVVNRWLNNSEIGAVLSRYHALVLPHIEASQSGVAALGLGAGMPVVATPVGGLFEQLLQGETGVFAHRIDAEALADAAERLIVEPGLYQHLRTRIAAGKDERSMGRFVRDLEAFVSRL